MSLDVAPVIRETGCFPCPAPGLALGALRGLRGGVRDRATASALRCSEKRLVGLRGEVSHGITVEVAADSCAQTAAGRQGGTASLCSQTL